MRQMIFAASLAAVSLTMPAAKAQIRTACEGAVVIGDVNTVVKALRPNGLCLQPIVDQCRQTSLCAFASCIGPAASLLKPTEVSALVSAAARYAMLLDPAPCPNRVWGEITSKDK